MYLYFSWAQWLFYLHLVSSSSLVSKCAALTVWLPGDDQHDGSFRLLCLIFLDASCQQFFFITFIKAKNFRKTTFFSWKCFCRSVCLKNTQNFKCFKWTSSPEKTKGKKHWPVELTEGHGRLVGLEWLNDTLVTGFVLGCLCTAQSSCRGPER